jgi:hypothetical protein
MRRKTIAGTILLGLALTAPLLAQDDVENILGDAGKDKVDHMLAEVRPQVPAGPTNVPPLTIGGPANLTLEARVVSAGAVELRWNQGVEHMLQRQAKGGAFEEVGRMALTAGTVNNVPMRSYFHRGLTADTQYTYRFIVPNGWHYDFGPQSVPAAHDHLRVSRTELYTDAKGYGFEKPGKGEGAHNPPSTPRELSFVEGAAPFIQNLPNGHYRVGAGGQQVGMFVINGAVVKTEDMHSCSVWAIKDFPVEVTDGKLVVETRGSRFCWLNIVPRDEPVKTLASADCRTYSLEHMVKVMNDVKQPAADRLAALYSLGDMRSAASKAAPAVAAVLLATEKEKGPMHWLAVWSLWKIGPEHVGDRGQRAAAEKILARFAPYNKSLLPAPARAVIQEANAERPLFGQYQMGLTVAHGEKLPPKVSDEAFFGRWNAASNAWAIAPVVQYDFSTNLNATLAAAKRGDYDAAKTELLAYYRERKDIPKPYVGDLTETSMLEAEAHLRGIRENYPRAEFKVSGDWQWHTVKMPTGSVVTACLVSDWERAGLVGIRSRENKGYAPRLEIVTDKTKHVLEVEGDTTIRAGKYAGINYGTNDVLMVQEGPIPEGPDPASDETMRAYLSFNPPASISTGEEKILSQTLHLYAKPLGERKEVSLAIFGIPPAVIQGREKSLTWGNHSTYLFLYKDIDFDWFRPPGAERLAKFWIPSGAFGGGGGINMMRPASFYAVTGNEQHAFNALFGAMDFLTKQRISHWYKVDVGRRVWGAPQMLLALNSEFTSPEVWTSLLKAFYESGRILSGEPGNGGNAARSIQFGWLLLNTYYPELSQPGWWQANAERQASNVRATLLPDGANGEACTGYIRGTLVAMKESIDVAMKTRGILLPGAEPYGRMAEYYMNVTTPAGTTYNWGPGGRGNVRSLVLEAGETTGNPHLIYFGTKGERGTEPPYQSRLYPVGKTFTMRTSWTDENGLGAFINARVGGPHSCPDDLNLDIYAYGRYLLADPGPGSYNPTDPSGQWQSGTTIAHNTITIDGENQSRNGQSDIKASAGQVFDYVTAWVESYGAGVRVYRRVLFVRPSFWIVSDYIRAKEGSHTYDQAWHPDLDSNPEMDAKTQRVQTRFVGTANVQLVPADPTEVKATIPDGWMERRQAKYVTFRKEGVPGDTTFDTVIYPTKAGDQTVVSVERLAVKGTGGELAKTNATALKVAIGQGRTGYYCHSYGGSGSTPTPAGVEAGPPGGLVTPVTIEFGGFAFDGEMAYVETDAKGAVAYAALRNGRSLTLSGARDTPHLGPLPQGERKEAGDGTTLPLPSGERAGVRVLVQANAPVEALGVRVEDGTLRIEGSVKTLDVTVRAPAAIKKVLLNGEETPFTQEDGMVRLYRSGGVAGFGFEGADIKGIALDPVARTIHVLVERGARLDTLKPRLELAEGYTVVGVQEADMADTGGPRPGADTKDAGGPRSPSAGRREVGAEVDQPLPGGQGPPWEVGATNEVRGHRGGDHLEPYRPGMSVNFAKAVQFVVKSGTSADAVTWTVAVHPMNRVAIPAFDASATGWKAPVGRNTDRRYKSLTGWNAQDDWLEWKIEVPASGKYVPAFMYASAHGSPLRDLAVDGEVKVAELRFGGTGDWGAKDTGWRDIVFAEGEGIALQKGAHTLRMTNLNGEGVNLGWIALVPVEELPVALDPKVKGRLAADYLAALEAEFKLRNPDLKK